MQILVSAKHKVVGIPNPPEEVTSAFPTAKTHVLSGVPHVLVQHGLAETFILRKMGFDVPSPILTHYDWAGSMVQPFEAQKKTGALLTMNMRAYVLNGKGTGKTKSALWAWDYLRSNNAAGKLLVTAPLSTLNFTWANEVMATLPHRRAAVVHGDKARRLQRLNDQDAEIFIINPDGLKLLEDEIIAKAKAKEITVWCIDELAVFRNAGSARTKCAMRISQVMDTVWGMSGDPMPHRPTDVYGQAKIVTPWSVPKYFKRFEDDLMYRPNEHNKFLLLPKPDAVERAFSVMQPAVRFTLDDIVELPEVVERFVDVELGTKQARVYHDIVSKCYAAVQSHEITAVNAGAAMNKLLQVSCGWVYTSEGAVVPLDNEKRIERLIDEIEGASRKVLVFVPFKHALAGISEALDAAGVEHAVVSGSTPARERDVTFNLFQKTDKYKVLAAHPACLAHGITLTSADTIVWFAPITSNEIYSQANARIRRVGQRHRQLILHLQGTPVEKKIYKMLQAQQLTQNNFLKLFEEATPTQNH